MSELTIRAMRPDEWDEVAELVRTLYTWGARNCELHLAQIRGPFHRPTGLIVPTFTPETG